MRRDYEFVPVTVADLPMLGRWLHEPHVRAWWGPAEREIALIEGDLGSGAVDMRIVCRDGVPFAYLQDYPAHHWDMPHYRDEPQGARAMDTFLGDPAWRGKGHAARYLRQRAEDLIAAGCPAVVIDPSPDNAPALRAYRAAGFEGETVRPNEDGAPVIPMRFTGRRR